MSCADCEVAYLQNVNAAKGYPSRTIRKSHIGCADFN